MSNISKVGSEASIAKPVGPPPAPPMNNAVEEVVKPVFLNIPLKTEKAAGIGKQVDAMRFMDQAFDFETNDKIPEAVAAYKLALQQLGAEETGQGLLLRVACRINMASVLFHRNKTITKIQQSAELDLDEAYDQIDPHSSQDVFHLLGNAYLRLFQFSRNETHLLKAKEAYTKEQAGHRSDRSAKQVQYENYLGLGLANLHLFIHRLNSDPDIEQESLKESVSWLEKSIAIQKDRNVMYTFAFARAIFGQITPDREKIWSTSLKRSRS